MLLAICEFCVRHQLGICTEEIGRGGKGYKSGISGPLYSINKLWQTTAPRQAVMNSLVKVIDQACLTVSLNASCRCSQISVSDCIARSVLQSEPCRFSEIFLLHELYFCHS